jgi:poly(3-hydroxybutyrate) depolymerase
MTEPLWRGAEQPARRGFGINDIAAASGRVPIIQTDHYRTPFAVLTHFERDGIPPPARRALVIPPLSGHFPFLFRDLVLALLPNLNVAVLEWINARHVPAAAGPFTLDRDIEETVTAIRHFNSDLHVIGVCQGAISALVATAILAQAGDAAIPRSVILIAAPMDPLANPTRVVRLIRARPLGWFERNVLARIGAPYAGAGRQVYPAHSQLTALMAYLTRHLLEGGLLAEKLRRDDGADPIHFPFLDAFTSVMDLPGQWFLDNIRTVFHERALPGNTLRWGGQPIDLTAMNNTALMTIEAENDDIAAPGQTLAAHALCPRLPLDRREHYLLPRGSHFSTFHGESARQQIAPRIVHFAARF